MSRLLSLVLPCLMCLAPAAVQAATVASLYSIAGSSDGALPGADVLQDGNLIYGTTSAGGAAGLGSI